MSTRSGSIDSLRGVAVLLVAQTHFLHLTGAYDALGAPQWLIRLAGGGVSGVDLFFVLSAYLLADGLLRRARQPNLVPTFYLRRAFRVLPMYWIMLSVGFALYWLWTALVGLQDTWLWAKPYPLWAYLIFIQNWWNGVTGPVASWFGPTWSLAVEEQFYLLLPLIALRLSPRGLAIIAATWIVAAPAVRVVSEAAAGPHASYYWSICRIDTFGWGLLIALAPQIAPDLPRRLPPLAARWGGAALLVVTLVVSHKASAAERALTASIVAFAGALLVWSVAARRREDGQSGLRFLAWCGERCYSLYLLQVPVLGLTFLLAGYLGPNAGVPHGPGLIALAVLLTFVLADVAYRRVEAPFMRMAPKLGARMKAPRATGARLDRETLRP